MKIKIVNKPPNVPTPELFAVRDDGVLMHDLIGETCGIDLTRYRIMHLDGDGLNNQTSNLVAVPRAELN